MPMGEELFKKRSSDVLSFMNESCLMCTELNCRCDYGDIFPRQNIKFHKDLNSYTFELLFFLVRYRASEYDHSKHAIVVRTMIMYLKS